MTAYLKGVQRLFNSHLSTVLLFVSCCVFLFVLPVIDGFPLWGFRICMTFVLVFSVFSLEKVRPYLVGFGFTAVLLDWFSDLGKDSDLNTLLRLLTFLFVFWVVARLMAEFLRQKKVSAYTLMEAVNGYLLLGIVFSGLAVVINIFQPGAYLSSHGQLKTNDLIYYTVVTLTTTGYGDVLPQTALAKSLSMMIAVCGQIYVAFLVGVLVGKYTNRLMNKDSEPG